MEALVEQPDTAEKQKSFDPLASIHLLRYDLDHYGEVLPETRQRVCDEELSYLVEGIDKAACTSFLIKRDGDDLVYFSQSTWRPYMGALLTGLGIARNEAEKDPRRQFLADRAVDDLRHGYELLAMQPGEQKVWHSPYAHSEEAQYGEEFIKDCGMNPQRKMGFLYQAVCQHDGSILLKSQTVDRSDDDAFQAVNQAAAADPQINMEAMVDIYDEHLQEKFGDHFFAGRRESKKNENAWDEIHNHRDLIEFHLNKLEAIASQAIAGAELENVTKRHLYGVWASFKKRLSGESISHTSVNYSYASHLYDPELHHMLEVEVRQNFKEFVSRGEVLVGCGGAIRIVNSENDVMDADASDVHTVIFGGSDSDRYGSLTFKCPAGHHNRRPRGVLLTKCQTSNCKAKVTC
ncbi:MAG TPA: hypothetical protein VN778_01660 [Verrucomicrobiae bacterium]|nr:hypothetical protein [Verrucomicrobiae bacterium]